MNTPRTPARLWERRAAGLVRAPGRFALSGAAALIAALILLPSGDAMAQYKYRSASGETVYSDMPPPDTPVQRLNLSASSAPTGARPELSPALQTLVRRQPVTVYTTRDCAPCQLARRHLAQRGIPYSEKTANSAGDLKAMTALGFVEHRFPSLSVGAERRSGFDSTAWDQLLSSAGYPARARLAQGWTPPLSSVDPASGLAGNEAGEPDTANGAEAPSGSSKPSVAARVPVLPVEKREPAIRF